MILYRKQKMYKKELSAIKKAINAYEKDILKDQQAWKKINGHTAELSQNLARALGLMADKGLPQYEDPQILAWRKRLVVVEKAIGKGNRLKGRLQNFVRK